MAKVSATTYLNKIANISDEDAKEYQKSDEQFLWCVDWLDISAHDPRCDMLVEILEDHIEEILMAEFKIVMKYNRGNAVSTRNVGTWEDRARELYGSVRRKLEGNKMSLNLTLVNPEGEIVLEHNQ